MTPYYEENGITIYHGDCRDVLPSLPPVDLVLTDPPYGIAYETTNTVDGSNPTWLNVPLTGDADTALRDWIIAKLSPLPMLIFGTWKSQRPPNVRQVLIWDKGPAFGMGDLSLPWKNSFEEIYVLGQGFSGHRGEGVLKGHIVVTWESKGRFHPTAKPISLIKALLQKSPFAKTILDPFMGSGTTLRAAKDLGRRAIGIEIEEKYCEIAANRLRQEVLSFEIAS